MANTYLNIPLSDFYNNIVYTKHDANFAIHFGHPSQWTNEQKEVIKAIIELSDYMRQTKHPLTIDKANMHPLQ